MWRYEFQGLDEIGDLAMPPAQANPVRRYHTLIFAFFALFALLMVLASNPT